MNRHILLHALGVVLLFAGVAKAETPKRVTILYDAFGKPSSLTMDFGFAALVEYGGKRILFDTGNNATILEHNVKALGVDLRNLDFVVMSHRHGDHRRAGVHRPKRAFGDNHVYAGVGSVVNL